ncbi:hypothetical protein FRC00_002953 [Tulasnella sp. 408]|nr:hypothetical protein FRC00_002953 [Tulasnella sp. 408]
MTVPTGYPESLSLEEETDRVHVTQNGELGGKETTLDLLDTLPSKSVDAKQIILNRFEAMLRYYHLQPRAFRDKMRQSGAVVGGFSALSLLLADSPEKPPYLDIFTTKADSDFGTHPVLVRAGVERLLQLRHIDQSQELHVNVVVAKAGNSAVVPLLKTNTTATMGYISADSIHHLYPELLQKKVAVSSLLQTERCCIPSRNPVKHWELSSAWQDHVSVLGGMGFALKETVDCSAMSDRGCYAAPRGFRDSSSLRLDFDDRGVQKSPWYETGAGFAGYDTFMAFILTEFKAIWTGMVEVN